MSDNNTNGQESDGTAIEPRTRRALERVLTVTHTDGTPISDDESPTVVSVHSGNSGKERRVDVREGRCTCPDHEHRNSVCYHIRRARMALGVESVDRDTLAACDVHSHFASNAPGPVVATSDGGVVGGGSADESDDDETPVATDGGRPDDVRKVDGFASNDPFYKCDRCGGIGDTVEMVDHHEDCPAVATDGGRVETTDESAGAGERVRVPVSGGVLVYERRAVGKELVGFEGVDDWDALAGALAAKGHDRGGVFHLPELDDDSSDDDGRDEPTRSEPADFGHGESTGVQEL